ncbi:hypothetical protein PG993_011317 [Apiospora rasikravindrae]|uniref:Uncharacterized protein n=1 Tax=Apiospora rasikravindrae TaxID=990691 RepID=A0ABR1SDV1_9PEZI
MKFLPIIISLFAAGALSQNGCGFPDGPTCESVGVGANGLEQFEDPDGCCLLPLRCGNIAGERCERVGDSPDSNPQGSPNGGPSGGPPTGKRNGRRSLIARGEWA